MKNNTLDTKKLIDYSVDFADKMLTDNQEFFPFAAAIDFTGNLIMTSDFEGDDFPLSQEVINKLQSILDRQLDCKERRAYALTYDVRVQKDNLSEIVDAIAIKIKHIDTQGITVYYFAYRLTSEKKVQHIDSWGEIIS